MKAAAQCHSCLFEHSHVVFLAVTYYLDVFLLLINERHDIAFSGAALSSFECL